MPYNIAANTQIASPGAAFLQARQQQFTNSLAQQQNARANADQAQQDQIFQNALAKQAAGESEARKTQDAKQAVSEVTRMEGVPDAMLPSFVAQALPHVAQAAQQAGMDPNDSASLRQLGAAVKAKAGSYLGIMPESPTAHSVPEGGSLVFTDASGKQVGNPIMGQPKPETFGAQQDMNLNGKPAVAQLGNRGTVRPVPGATPYNKPTSSALSGANAANLLTPQGLDNSAERYRQTGTLPSLGMGGAQLRVKIINRAADLAMANGDDASAASIKQQANKASQAALGAITKQKTQTGAFEKTAVANLDLALEQAKQANLGSVPLFNKALIAFRTGVTGDPATAKFVNVLTAARNEYAKVLSSSTGAQGITDAGRREAEDLFSKVQTLDQLQATIGVAKQEMTNRMTAFDQQISDLQPAIGAAPTAQTPKATPSGETAAQRAKRLGL